MKGSKKERINYIILSGGERTLSLLLRRVKNVRMNAKFINFFYTNINNCSINVAKKGKREKERKTLYYNTDTIRCIIYHREYKNWLALINRLYIIIRPHFFLKIGLSIWSCFFFLGEKSHVSPSTPLKWITAIYLRK